MLCAHRHFGGVKHTWWLVWDTADSPLSCCLLGSLKNAGCAPRLQWCRFALMANDGCCCLDKCVNVHWQVVFFSATMALDAHREYSGVNEFWGLLGRGWLWGGRCNTPPVVLATSRLTRTRHIGIRESCQPLSSESHSTCRPDSVSTHMSASCPRRQSYHHQLRESSHMSSSPCSYLRVFVTF